MMPDADGCGMFDIDIGCQMWDASSSSRRPPAAASKAALVFYFVVDD
jgi:hypothetical protein